MEQYIEHQEHQEHEADPIRTFAQYLFSRPLTALYTELTTDKPIFNLPDLISLLRKKRSR